MPRKFVAGLVLGSICTIGGLYYHYKSHHGPSNPDVFSDIIASHQHYIHPNIKVSEDVKWTTVKQIEESLKDTPPMHVGFDIDDTVLFPNTSFHVSYKKFCANDNSPLKKTCVHQQKFWDFINASGHLSPPKAIGRDLIEMHQRRGDTIFFITAREKSKFTAETMTQTLKETFNIKNMQEVIYLGMSSINTEKPGKTDSIISNNIKVFYGDSDADIAAAVHAKIRGIRVMRAPNSQDNHNMPLNGRYGEEVIIGSDM